MPPQTHRSPGRLLAPVALVAVFIALMVVVLGSTGSSEPEATDSFTAPRSTAAKRAARPARVTRGVYTVKSGDTLGGIAERNGITVERLQELNPDLDARTLVTGQRLKLSQ